jgi:hypothetical protein
MPAHRANLKNVVRAKKACHERTGTIGPVRGRDDTVPLRPHADHAPT